MTPRYVVVYHKLLPTSMPYLKSFDYLETEPEIEIEYDDYGEAKRAARQLSDSDRIRPWLLSFHFKPYIKRKNAKYPVQAWRFNVGMFYMGSRIYNFDYRVDDRDFGSYKEYCELLEADKLSPLCLVNLALQHLPTPSLVPQSPPVISRRDLDNAQYIPPRT